MTKSTKQKWLDSKFAEWVVKTHQEASKGIGGCSFCARPEVAEDIRSILHTMVKQKAYRISVPKIYDKIAELHSNLRSFETFRKHLGKCEKDLWKQARGETPSKPCTVKES